MDLMIDMRQGVARHPDYRLPTPVDVQIARGEQVAIVGRNGCGKSLLVDMLTGKHPLLGLPVVLGGSVRCVTFEDVWGTKDGPYCYQQRWNMDELEGVPTVRDRLAGLVTSENAVLMERLTSLLGLERLLDERLVSLSSGEMRRWQLARVLLSSPDILVLDNPYIGLDAQTRDVLTRLLRKVAMEMGVTLVLVLSRRGEVPDFVTRVIDLTFLRTRTSLVHADEEVRGPTAVTAAVPGTLDSRLSTLDTFEKFASRSTPPLSEEIGGRILELKDVTIRYGERMLLDGLTMTVRRGEHWALSGPNGSGKSTLLSLVCADCLQAYSNNVVLFGQRQGPGVSIWDVKRRIGYVSPELHRAYRRDVQAASVVASGLRDTVGLYGRAREEEMDAVRKWMAIFGIDSLAERSFLRLSSGEQRLVLLARAFVKEPELLVLDEPMHGLDDSNVELVRRVIDAYCEDADKTLLMVTHYREELPDCIDHYKDLPGLRS